MSDFEAPSIDEKIDEKSDEKSDGQIDGQIGAAIKGGDVPAAKLLLEDVLVKIRSIEAQIAVYALEKRSALAAPERHVWSIRARTALQFARNHHSRLQDFLKQARFTEHVERNKPQVSEQRARQIARTAMAYRFRFLESQSGAGNVQAQEDAEKLQAQLFALIDALRAEEPEARA